jgi:hypothetical protein
MPSAPPDPERQTAVHALAVATARCHPAKGTGRVKVIVGLRELHHVEVISRVKVIGLEKVDGQKHAKVTGLARVIVLAKVTVRAKAIVRVRVIGPVPVLNLADPKGAHPKRAKVTAVPDELVSARPARVLVDLAAVAAADLDLLDLDRLAQVALVREPKAVVVEAKARVVRVAKVSALAVRTVHFAMRTRPSKQPFEPSPAAEDALSSAVPSWTSGFWAHA